MTAFPARAKLLAQPNTTESTVRQSVVTRAAEIARAQASHEGSGRRRRTPTIARRPELNNLAGDYS